MPSSIPPLVLFLHLAGAFLLFGTIAVEQVVMTGLRHASTIAQGRIWAAIATKLKFGFAAGSVALLATGLYLAATQFGWSLAWLDVSLGATLLLSAVAPAVAARRVRAIARAFDAPGEGPLSPEQSRLTQDEVLWLNSHCAGAAVLGIVFVMTMKPTSFLAAASMLVAWITLGYSAAQFRALPTPSAETAAQPEPSPEG